MLQHSRCGWCWGHGAGPAWTRGVGERPGRGFSGPWPLSLARLARQPGELDPCSSQPGAQVQGSPRAAGAAAASLSFGGPCSAHCGLPRPTPGAGCTAPPADVSASETLTPESHLPGHRL